MRNLKIAFTGASGSGKTTLVKFVEKEFNLTHLNGSAGTIGAELMEEVKAKHKYYADGHLSVIQRSLVDPSFARDFQNAVLDMRTKAITTTNDFVTDRSPLDNLTYFSLQAAPVLTEQECRGFEYKCLVAMSELTHLIYIKPCQPDGLVENNYSRIPVKLYQDAVDSVFGSFLTRMFHAMDEFSLRKPKLLIINFWDLDNRKQLLKTFLQNPN